MQVILRQDLEKLGKTGDVVKVKDGFARNFLIPRGLAFVANEVNLKKIEQENLRITKEAEKQLQKFKDLARELEAISLTIPVEVNEEEKLYGSISQPDIISALKEEGYAIDRENIKLEQPIKELGIYEVSIKLHPQIETKVKIWVVKK